MSSNSTFAFDKENYKFLFIGIGVVILGFILMIGGASTDPPYPTLHCEVLDNNVIHFTIYAVQAQSGAPAAHCRRSTGAF